MAGRWNWAGERSMFTGEIRTVSTRPDALPLATTAAPIPAAAHAPTNLPEAIRLASGTQWLIVMIEARGELVTKDALGAVDRSRTPKPVRPSFAAVTMARPLNHSRRTYPYTSDPTSTTRMRHNM